MSSISFRLGLFDLFRLFQSTVYLKPFCLKTRISDLLSAKQFSFGIILRAPQIVHENFNQLLGKCQTTDVHIFFSLSVLGQPKFIWRDITERGEPVNRSGLPLA